jgi:hypothetical protein
MQTGAKIPMRLPEGGSGKGNIYFSSYQKGRNLKYMLK